MIKFVSDLRQVGGFHRVPRFAKALDFRFQWTYAIIFQVFIKRKIF
jgi:hypothetical protein